MSAAGREYKQAVAWIAKDTMVKFGCERLSVVMKVHFSSKRRRDVDNVPKLILDAMAHGGLYDDDSQIDDLRIVRMGQDKANPRAIVIVSVVDG